MRDLTLTTATVLLSLLLLAAAGCGGADPATAGEDHGTSVVFMESEPVTGWLDVLLPGAPVAMDAGQEDIWIITESGTAMCWNSCDSRWSSAEVPSAFDVSVTGQGPAILTPDGLTLLSGGEMTTFGFDGSSEPLSISGTDGGPVVLFADGTLARWSEDGREDLVEPSERQPSGSLCTGNGKIAWMNEDGTVSVFDTEDGLLTEYVLPEGTTRIDLLDGNLYSSGEDGISIMAEDGTWEHAYSGTLAGSGMVASQDGFSLLDDGSEVTSGLPFEALQTACLSDGTVWALGETSLSVWAEIGSVETRLPEADILRLTYRMAGQTGQGDGSGSGVVSSGASLGGVFRIYESVSSRPDPFSEFPAASRDLRRPIEELTIEELHLVGITLDPSGGDQAMVEDANGVAYVLREGTMLRNNTRIAEITGNEVIVVQEVIVGSEDDLGGTTSIPTIFSMRLHEEGGL